MRIKEDIYRKSFFDFDQDGRDLWASQEDI